MQLIPKVYVVVVVVVQAPSPPEAAAKKTSSTASVRPIPSIIHLPPPNDPLSPCAVVLSSQPTSFLYRTLPHLPAMESKIPDFLAEQQANGTPETQTYFLTFEEFWERKLWHQLTDSLVEFFRLPESAPQRLAIFKTFVLSFADRINQLKFVALGLMASTECAGKWSRKAGGLRVRSPLLAVRRIAHFCGDGR